MTAAAHTSAAAVRGLPAALLPLARLETRRLLRHPVLGLATGLTALMVPATSNPTALYLVHTVVALVPIGLAAMAVLFLAASRTRRDDAGELIGPMASSAATRSGGLLLGAAVALVPASLLIGVLVGLTSDGAGLPLATPSGVVARVPSTFEVLAPVVAVLACAAAGVLLGRLLPHPVVIPALAVFGIVQLIAVSWSLDSAWRWLLPFVDATQQVGWVQVNPGSGYAIVSGVAVTQLGWHLGYLIALTVTMALLTLAVDHRDRRLRLVVALAAVTTLALGVIQTGVIQTGVIQTGGVT